LDRDSGHLVSHPVVFRRHPDGDVTLNDPWSGTQARLTLSAPPTVLDLEVALSSMTMEIEQGTIDAAKEWVEFGWWPSLQLYMASRSPNYVDLRDREGAVRRSVVKTYRHKDLKAPTNKRTKGIKLGRTVSTPTLSIEDALYQRRTVRKFAANPILLSELQCIFWQAFSSVREADKRRTKLKHDGDTLHHLASFGIAQRVFLVATNVASLEPGLYE